MSLHAHLDLAASFNSPNPLTKQSRIPPIQALRIGHLRGVVPVNLGLQKLPPSVRALGIQQRLGVIGAHARRTAPQVMNGPVLPDLRGGAHAVHDEDVLERSGHVEIRVGGVEEDDDLVAVGQRSAPDVRLADAVAIHRHVEVALDALHGAAARVLVEGDDGGIVDDGEGRGRHGAQVVAEQQGGLEGCPQGEVGFVLLTQSVKSRPLLLYQNECFTHLFFSHAAVANLQHVQVVPSPRQPPINVRRHLVDDGQHGAVRAGRDAVRVGGIGARAQVVGSRKRVVDVARDAP